MPKGIENNENSGAYRAAPVSNQPGYEQAGKLGEDKGVLMTACFNPEMTGIDNHNFLLAVECGWHDSSNQWGEGKRFFALVGLRESRQWKAIRVTKEVFQSRSS